MKSKVAVRMVLLTILLFVGFSCEKDPAGSNEEETGTVTDIDGNVYQTVKIGDQWWMAENLKVTHYRNGDAIPKVTDATEWTNLTTGAYCEYDNTSANVDAYGRLYNWYAVNDSRNIAPEGWHVPTDDEWQILVDYCGGGFIAGGKLKSTSGWDNDGNGTDDYGFAALPGGRRSSGGSFDYVGGDAAFWSATESDSSYAWDRRLSDFHASILRGGYYEQGGFSLRLLRD